MIQQYYTKEELNGKITYKPVDMNKVTICGKTLDEVVMILQSLDIERIYQMKMTMENLKTYMELYDKEQSKILEEQLSKMTYEVDKNWKEIHIPAFRGDDK